MKRLGAGQFLTPGCQTNVKLFFQTTKHSLIFYKIKFFLTFFRLKIKIRQLILLNGGIFFGLVFLREEKRTWVTSKC